jgi:hypothetical protein
MPVVHRIRMNPVHRLRCILGNCIRCDELPWTVVRLKLAILHYHVIEETHPNFDVLGPGSTPSFFIKNIAPMLSSLRWLGRAAWQVEPYLSKEQSSYHFYPTDADDWANLLLSRFK